MKNKKKTKRAKIKKNKKNKTNKNTAQIRNKNNKTITQKPSINKQAIIILLIIFLITQSLGLIAAYRINELALQEPIFSEDINALENGVYLFVMILIMTGFLLIILKYKKSLNLIWAIEALAVFSASTILFGIFLGEIVGMSIALAILLWRYTHRESISFRTFVSIITIAGAGAFIGASIGVLPVFAFIIVLAIYDIIAVFYTKHMVTIGKAVTQKNFAFTVAIPTKEHNFELGNGDLVIPLIVATSLIINGPFKNSAMFSGLFVNNIGIAIICLGASFLGLVFSINSVALLKKPMPALPPQTLLMAITIIIAILLGL